MKYLQASFYLTIIIIVFIALSCEQATAMKKDKPTVIKVSDNWKSKQNTIDSIITQAITDSIIPGAVVLVSQNNQTLYTNAYGYSRLYDYGKVLLPTPERMTTGHIFDLASLTKVLATTMGIMRLVDYKKIDLDTQISNYLPQLIDTDKGLITIRHLLSHTSGLSPWKPIYYHARKPVAVLDYIAELPLAYPIGAERHYSDLGFMLLGYIIEHTTGIRLDQYLDKEVYDPLGLNHTMFNPKNQQWPFAATSHGNPFEYKMVEDDDFGFKCDEDIKDFSFWRQYTLSGEVNDGNSYYANEGIAGHAGLFSNTADIQKLLQVLISEGSLNDQEIISPETIDEFLKQDQYENGLGWAMSTEVLPVTDLPAGGFGHTGFTGTYVLCLPDRSVSLILLTNRQNLDVKDSGSYQSVTQLRKNLSDYIIRATE